MVGTSNIEIFMNSICGNGTVKLPAEVLFPYELVKGLLLIFREDSPYLKMYFFHNNRMLSGDVPSNEDPSMYNYEYSWWMCSAVVDDLQIDCRWSKASVKLGKSTVVITNECYEAFV